MKPTVRTLLLALAMAAAVSNAGCALPAGSATGPVRIGIITPRGGALRGAGESVLEGARLAIDEINSDGGAGGRRLVLVTADEPRGADESAAVLGRLVRHEVVAVVGPVTDAATVAATPVAERLGVVLISPGATSPLPYGGHFIFRTAVPAVAQSEALVPHLVGVLGLKRIAVIHDSNDYGTMAALAFEDAVRRHGGAVTGRRLFRDGESDFTRHVQGTLMEGAQAVYIAGYPAEAALLLRRLRSASPAMVVVGSDALYSRDTLAWAGRAAEGLVVPAGFVAETRLPVVGEFIARYRARYGRDPDQLAAQAYDAVSLVALGVRRAGTNREKIRDVIAGVRRFPGVTGDLSFDQWGNPVRGVMITTVKSGGFIPLDSPWIIALP